MVSVQWQDASALAFAGFLSALVQLLGLFEGPITGLLVAAATGVLMAVFQRFYHPAPLARWWAAPLMLLLAGAAASGVVAAYGEQVTSWRILLLIPFVSSGSSLLTRSLDHSMSRRCSLCNGRLQSGPAFECPRCGLEVCEKRCWSYETLRCKLCLENEVPIFPADGRWWDRQLGPRFHQSRCRLCFAESAVADLRTCRRCGCPQCRNCWDTANGRCARCEWTIENLPAKLTRFLPPPRQSEPYKRNAQRG